MDKKDVLSSHRVLEERILAKLADAPNRVLSYKELYDAHRRESLKETILKMESEGKVRVLPRRNTKKLGFVADIQSIGTPSAEEIFSPLIKNFEHAKSIQSREVILKKINDHVSSEGIFCLSLVDFLIKEIKNEENRPILEPALFSLHNILRRAEVQDLGYILDKLPLLSQDYKLISSLKGTLSDRKVGNYAKYFASSILGYLSPKDNLKILLSSLQKQDVYTDASSFAQLVITSQVKSNADKSEILNVCDNVLNTAKNELAKEAAKQIFAGIR